MKSIAGGGGESLERIHYLHAPLPLHPRISPTPATLGHLFIFMRFECRGLPLLLFDVPGNRKEKRTSRERERRVYRGWISRAERVERERDGEPRAIHGGLVKSAGETRNP